jgi:hypothetical protein
MRAGRGNKNSLTFLVHDAQLRRVQIPAILLAWEIAEDCCYRSATPTLAEVFVKGIDKEEDCQDVQVDLTRASLPSSLSPHKPGARRSTQLQHILPMNTFTC